MANLLEALKPQMQDTTSGLATLLRAKSGKAVAGPSTALSTQQEQAAVAQTAQQMQPIEAAAQTQEMAQEQQSREIQQKTEQQLTDIAQSQQSNQMQTQLRTDQLLQELQQGRGKMDLARYQSGLEQVGFNLRLSNKEYVDTLQREGSRARLDDKFQFEEQLTASILEDNKMLLQKQLGNKSILSANDREWQVAMERMGSQVAYDIFRNDMKAEKERGLATGIGSIFTTAVGAYGTYKTDQAKSDYYSSPEGKKDTSFEAYSYRKKT